MGCAIKSLWCSDVGLQVKDFELGARNLSLGFGGVEAWGIRAGAGASMGVPRGYCRSQNKYLEVHELRNFFAG